MSKEVYNITKGVQPQRVPSSTTYGCTSTDIFNSITEDFPTSPLT
jgi:hypothetical protein